MSKWGAIVFFFLALSLAPRADPKRSYQCWSLGGHLFQVETFLVQQDRAMAERTCLRYARAFDDSVLALPYPSRAELRSLPTFVLFGSRSPFGGKDNGLDYRRPGQPSYDPACDPRWDNCIVVYSAENYLAQTDLWARKAVQHELSHAYQLLHWTETQPDILAAYQHACAQGLYRRVTDDEGKLHAEAYALTNQLEYFAELSCMYFARCNYPPQDRAALQGYDPVGFQMIRRMWEAPPPRALRPGAVR